MLSERAAGIGTVVIGCSIYLGGLAELLSGQLLFAGGGKHPWLRGVLTSMLGQQAYIGAAFLAFCVGSFFIMLGIRLIRRSRDLKRP